MAKRLHTVIVEPSVIIRSGIVSILKQITTLHLDIAELPSVQRLAEQLSMLKPDILVVNPVNLGGYLPSQIKSDINNQELKIVAIQSTLTDRLTLQEFDESISIYDSIDAIKSKLTDVIVDEDSVDNKKELSKREKEIIICVVKGMTNKLIADELFLSTHTVISHRRNIASKLQIHSPAGLTIYAIVNKLVDISEIKNTIGE